MSRSLVRTGAASRRAILAGGLACALLLPGAAHAQTNFELIYAFRVNGMNPVGRLAEGPDGSLYGATRYGGVQGGNSFGDGTIFALRPQASGSWSFETIHVFQNFFEGREPFGGVTLGSDGDLYGLATHGAPVFNPDGDGTAFRLSPSGEFSVIHQFMGHDDGRTPMWRLREGSDGAFYGSTCGSMDSTVFRLTAAGSFTPLYRFKNPLLEGACPVAELIEQPDGLLYGHATYGGAPRVPGYGRPGTLFRLDPHEPQPQATILHAFNGSDGAQPAGGLTPGPSGALYGTARMGGPFGLGSIFRREATGEVTTVHAFQGDDGARPYGSLFRGGDGALYGTASEGGADGAGTLFRMDDNGEYSVLHSFTRDIDGLGPVELMQARDGYFYGVTYMDGPGRGGTVFRLGPGNTFQTVHVFSDAPSHPESGVIQATDGNFYGTTRVSSQAGAVFRLSPTRELTILHEFPGGGSVDPSGLIQAADGFLYGTTRAGRSYEEKGTVFRIRTTGEDFAVVHSFAFSELGIPENGVVQASDGNFYGTTPAQIDFTQPDLPLVAGTIFRMDASGNLTTLHSVWGANCPLVEGPDGALYGTTVGSVFKVTTDGVFTQLHVFSFESNARGGLTRAPDGRLYGVTERGGASDSGTIFRVEPAGGITTVYDAGGSWRSPTILAASDGALYVAVGDENTSFFRFTTEGVTTLDFTWAGPPSRLIQASDGAIYGTVTHDGRVDRNPHGGGVFRLTLPPLPGSARLGRRTRADASRGIEAGGGVRIRTGE